MYAIAEKAVLELWQKAAGKRADMLENNMVDGIIFLSSFACGIDSFILKNCLQRYNRRQYKIPYTLITVDEHTGHAGFNTRLEAFLDMIRMEDKQ
jgi:predicted nucleotide-binding protein (sugar kinase/HSP70/actin superfamily)